MLIYVEIHRIFDVCVEVEPPKGYRLFCSDGAFNPITLPEKDPECVDQSEVETLSLTMEKPLEPGE